jgi:tripartite-type tricarboxylate transporter receptor subunit TctC
MAMTREANMPVKNFLGVARTLFAVVMSACIAASTLDRAAAQGYPNRPVRLVVPLVAGSPGDVVARLVADKLSIALKQPIVVENRPGAAGNIGTELIAKSAPDGYTLGMVLGSTLTVNPSVYRSMPFDPDKDLRLISVLSTSGQMLVVHPSVPVSSVKEFVAFARAASVAKQPITYGSGGVGIPGHLAMENFRVRAGFDAVHVPYRGNTPVVVDLLAGQIKFAFISSAGLLDRLQTGRLKGLAVSRITRSSLTPDVPTIAESGYPGFSVETDNILLGPAGLSGPIAVLLEREVAAVLRLPDVVERLHVMDMVPGPIVGNDMQTRIKADRAQWAKVVAAAHMQLE